LGFNEAPQRNLKATHSTVCEPLKSKFFAGHHTPHLIKIFVFLFFDLL